MPPRLHCHVAVAYGASDGAYPAALESQAMARTVMPVAVAAFCTDMTGVAAPVLL